MLFQTLTPLFLKLAFDLKVFKHVPQYELNQIITLNYSIYNSNLQFNL